MARNRHNYQPLNDEDSAMIELIPNEQSLSVSKRPVHREIGIVETWKRFPKTVFPIFGNEFCERFSYYGMRTVLTLYFVNVLNLPKSEAVANFHLFIVVCYLSPVLGSILADGYIGKFHTILWVSLFYASGNIVLAVAAVYEPDSPVHPYLDYTGLLIIGLGTGGIKPCVSAFGGDQFKKGEEDLLEKFFSVFYFSINAGAVISTFVTPILRTTSCLGQYTCFPAAFGLPAVLMVVSVLCFAAGAGWYRKSPPKENVIGKVFFATSVGPFSLAAGPVISFFQHAVRLSFARGAVSRERWILHWLDDHECTTDSRCSQAKCAHVEFLNDVWAFLRVCVMFLPVPFFWALYDQQGSRWVLQAVDMDGRIGGGVTLLPDQMGTLNSVLILCFIPIFQSGVYPLVRRCGIDPTPLRRMTVGGVLAALSFVVAAFVQFGVNTTLGAVPSSGTVDISFVNALNCELSGYPNGTAYFALPPNSTTKLSGISTKEGSSIHNFRFNASSPDCMPRSMENIALNVSDGAAFYSVLSHNGDADTAFKADLEKSEAGEGQFKLSVANFLNSSYVGWGFWCRVTSDGAAPCHPPDPDTFAAVWLSPNNATKAVELKPNRWRLFYADTARESDFKKKHLVKGRPVGVEFAMDAQGGIYTLTIWNDIQAPHKIRTVTTQVVRDNSVSILWQVPQYVVITAAEILFSITGLEFSYSQAPPSMKSVLQAAWLLTVAFGDFFDFVLAEARIFDNVAYELFLFAGIMLVVIIIFALMSIFWYEYTYYEQAPDEELEEDKQELVEDEE